MDPGVFRWPSLLRYLIEPFHRQVVSAVTSRACPHAIHSSVCTVSHHPCPSGHHPSHCPGPFGELSNPMLPPSRDQTTFENVSHISCLLRTLWWLPIFLRIKHRFLTQPLEASCDLALVFVRRVPRLRLPSQTPCSCFRLSDAPHAVLLQGYTHLPTLCLLVFSYWSFLSPALASFFREMLPNHTVRTSFSQARILGSVFSCSTHHRSQLYVNLCLSVYWLPFSLWW